MRVGICSLCLQEKELQKKSHIYPKFLYKSLFSRDGKISVLRTLDAYFQFHRDGYYEPHLLCKECDNKKIGSIESHGARILNEAINYKTKEKFTPTIVSEKEGMMHIVVPNFDYDSFKLFLLSILWKSHVAKGKLFEHVDLKEQAEQIRLIVLNGETTTEFDYFMFLAEDFEYSRRFIAPPVESLSNGSVYYILYFLGYVFKICLKPSFDDELIQKVVRQDDRQLHLVKLNKELTEVLLSKFLP